MNAGVEPDPRMLPVLALLQGWCGTPKPPSFIQLTRRQLRELAAAASDLPVFVDGGRTVAWSHGALVEEPPLSPALETQTGPTPSRPSKPSRAAPQDPLVVDGSEHYLAVTLPSREDPRYREAVELLKSAGFALEPSNRKWWLRDRHKTLTFLATHGERLRGALGAQFTPNFAARTAHLSSAEVTC